MKSSRCGDRASLGKRASLLAIFGGMVCAAVVLFGYVGDPKQSAFSRTFGPIVGEALIMLVFAGSMMASALTALGLAVLAHVVLIKLGIARPLILRESTTVREMPTMTSPTLGGIWDRDLRRT